MFANIFKRLKNGRIATLGAFLFAALMTFSLCGLNAASEAEIRKYEDAYNNLPVTMTVTSLTGIRRDGLELPAWVVNVFTEKPMDTLTKDLEIKMTLSGIDSAVSDGNTIRMDKLIGITSKKPDDRLDDETLFFLEGYDETVFRSEVDNTYYSPGEDHPKQTFYIIIPKELYDAGCEKISVTKSYDDTFDAYPIAFTTREFIPVGYHTLGEGLFFCPYNMLWRLMRDIGMPRYADSLSATVGKNEWIDKIHEQVDEWFVEPSLTAERVPWDYSFYFYYPFALDIDDSALIRAGEVMKTNILINKIGTALVFILSAGAGFLVGFLTVNRRRREIMLMRTLGMPDRQIFRDFFIEQGLCALAGALFGGIFFLWQPIERIALFILLNFAGLCISIIVFLKKNLLTSIKEE